MSTAIATSEVSVRQNLRGGALAEFEEIYRCNEIELMRGRRAEILRIQQAAPEQAAPVLKRYMNAVAVARPFFDVTPESSIDAFVREAPAHPVFRLIPAGAARTRVGVRAPLCDKGCTDASLGVAIGFPL